jgi:hypothetical protein
LQIDVINARADALAALNAIMAQGEGWEPGQDTHYHRFLTLYKTFADFPAAWPVPIDPSSGDSLVDPAREENRIAHPVSRDVARLANVRYRFVLALLSHLMMVPRDDPDGLRSDYLMPWSRTEMRRLLRGLGEALVLMPRTADGDPRRAAAPFELGDWQLPTSPSDAVAAHRALIRESADLIASIRRQGGATIAPLLAEIEKEDRDRAEIVSQL